MAKILVIDDEQILLDTVRYNLARSGHQVRVAADGEAGLRAAREDPPDLVLLDVMLPRMDGLEVCRILRGESSVPIVMLTARDEEPDRVLGLEIGADDYITKPFSMRELQARVKALLRRVEMAPGDSMAADQPLRAGHLQADPVRHQVTSHGHTLHLKPKEYELLVFLMRNPGRAFSRSQLLERVWGFDYSGGTRTVDVHIRWLREKVELDASEPTLIETVWGMGYRFRM